MAALRNRIGIFQITNWDNFGHKLSSFRGFIYATKRAALITCKTVKQKSYIQIECSFFVAERKGFEPLRALGALHDFQSCALDQLSHLSIFFCAAPDCMSYYSNTNFKCQALFCIFLQKNLRWARCMQNVRANCIFCTFYPLANGGV